MGKNNMGENAESYLGKHCNVSKNKDGDTFVGIKVDTNGFLVSFPSGYRLPTKETEIRMDIRQLIRVLSRFSKKIERLLSKDRFGRPQNVEFPINAYRNVIEYYFSIGGNYYVETDTIFKTSSTGRQDWARTVKHQIPLVQQNDKFSSLIFTSYTVRSNTPNTNKLITEINRYCVHEAFSKLGCLYTSYIPEKPRRHLDLKASISIIQNKLSTTYDDKKRCLFQSMKDMLEYLDIKPTDNQTAYFGTDSFEYVWQRLIDEAFGERNKNEYFPHSIWLLDYGEDKRKRPLQPDTIMIYGNDYYVLDAKYYKYGWDGDSDNLPNGSSISKQIIYGEYLEKHKNNSETEIFNAFILPYNEEHNPFGLSSTFGNIGEAVGEWRENTKHYERIQGIVIDTKHLMYHYSRNIEEEKGKLVAQIEKVKQRSPIRIVESSNSTRTNCAIYEIQPDRPLMIAEDTTPHDDNDK